MVSHDNAPADRVVQLHEKLARAFREGDGVDLETADSRCNRRSIDTSVHMLRLGQRQLWTEEALISAAVGIRAIRNNQQAAGHLPMVSSSPVRSTVSTPLRVLNDMTFDGLFRAEYRTAADAMVACPHSATSRVGVNQRRPNTDPDAWSPAPEVAALSSWMNAVSDIFISIATSSISLSVSDCKAESL